MPEPISRRAFFQVSAAAAGGLLLPRLGAGDALAATTATLINPYSGSIPLTFPLPSGTYQAPVANNWHQSREGQIYQWNHRNSKEQRAHDGVDAYPATSSLPPVYAPLQGIVAAVCLRSDNTLNATVTYTASPQYPPPWNYSGGIDDVAGLPLYGNFVWLSSTDPSSAGYFVFFCHLQNEPVLQALQQAMRQALANGQQLAVTSATQLGVMGDTGNAQGTPQLHTEIHYPRGRGFSCTGCRPRTTLTSIDPVASLANAKLR